MNVGKAPPDNRAGPRSAGDRGAGRDERLAGGRSALTLADPPDKPQITGLVTVDLSDCVDNHGFPTHEARQRIGHTLVASPAGVSVEIRLGNIKWLDEPTRRVLVDAGAGAGEIILVSSDPEVLHHEIRDLRWYFTEAAS